VSLWNKQLDAPGFVLGISQALTEWDPCRLWNPGIEEVWIGNVNLCPGLAWEHIVMGCSSEGSLKGRLQQNCQEIANQHFVVSQTSYIVSVCLHPNQSICSISNIVRTWRECADLIAGVQFLPCTVDAVAISDEVASCTGIPLTCSKSYKYYILSIMHILSVVRCEFSSLYTGHWSASTQGNGPGTSWRLVNHMYKHAAKGITAGWFHRSSIKFSSLHKGTDMLVEDKRMLQQKLEQQMLQQREKQIEHL